jgi:uncharacterized protein (DUF885 family)
VSIVGDRHPHRVSFDATLWDGRLSGDERLVDGAIGMALDNLALAPVSRRVEEYVARHYAFHPHMAIWDGRHEHDGRVPDYSPGAIATRVRELDEWTQEVAPCRLDTQAARDLALVDYARRYEIFRWREWRPHERNPAFYYGALDVSIYLKREYADADERLRGLTSHLEGVHEVLLSARQNLRTRLPREALAQAIQSYTGLAEYYDRHIRQAGRLLARDRAALAAFERAAQRATSSVTRFVAYLRERLAEPAGDYRLGEPLFTGLLARAELLDVDLSQLRRAAEDDLARSHARLEELAGRSRVTVDQALRELGRAGLPLGAVLSYAEGAVDEMRAFLSRAGVVDLEPTESMHLQVVETPTFMRSGAAFMDVPGPFERPGLPAYFYVTLPGADWPADVSQAWLAKLNPWGLQNTTSHEVLPGHMLHFAHLARVPSSAARAITSYGSVEGWAHYAEEMLIETGYGRHDPRVEMAQLTMALLRDCRCLVALDLHTGRLTLTEAAQRFAAVTGLAPIRCRQEARRGAQDPAYCVYTLGKLMLRKLRDDYARQEGQRYSVRRFHDALLACGAPPLPLARRMLLADATGAVL